MMEKLCLFWKACHAGLIRIRYRDGTIGPLKPNEGQARVHVKAMQMAAAGKPIRLVILKGRKIGVSTWWQAFGVFMVCHWPQVQCKTMAHVAESTQEIFGIAKTVADEYKAAVPTNPTENGVKNPANGSWYRCYTAGGEAVGAGGTPTLLHRSELAFWTQKKDENDKSSGESVPYDPNTVIVDESTAKGRELFFQRFTDAHNPEHPFEPVFLAWYIGEDNRIPIDKPLSLDEDEREIDRRARAEGIEIAHEAFAWRRMKLQELGEGDFRQQHPSTPEEAVMGSKGLILTGLRDCLYRPEEFPYEPSLIPAAQRVGGIDFGFHDPCVIWSGYYIDGILWATTCWRQTESLSEDQVAGLRKSTTYFCDPANLSDRKHLAQAADRQSMYCKFGAAPRRKHPGEDCDTTELKALAGMIRDGRLRILYTEAAQLILEADNLAWNEKTGKPDKTRTADCGHYDTIDSFKYLAMGCLHRDREQPRNDVKRGESRRESMAEW